MFKTDKNKKKFLFGKRFNEALMILYALAVILPVSYDTIRGSAPMPPLMKSLSAAVLSLLMVLVCLLALRAVRSLHLPGGYREQVQKDWIFFGVFFHHLFWGAASVVHRILPRLFFGGFTDSDGTGSQRHLP